MTEAAAFEGNTHIAVVVDKSGSMGAVRDDTIGGFNTYLTDRRREPRTTMTVVFFADSARVVHKSKEPINIPMLSRDNYVPGGNTALFDGIDFGIRQLEEGARAGDRFLVVIITDGAENASREMNRATIKARIEEREARGNWTFVYLAANQDAWAVGQSFGISARANTSSYAATGQGTQEAFRRVSASTARYSRGAGGQSVGFFDPEEAVRVEGAVDFSLDADVPTAGDLPGEKAKLDSPNWDIDTPLPPLGMKSPGKKRSV